MKKLIALLGAAVALFACAKMETEKQQEAPASTPVTFKVNMVDMDATKTDAKAAWADGDVIYVTFKGIKAKYLTLTYNSGTSTWAISGDAFSKGDYEALGGDYKLSAVHFPVAVDPAWDGSVLNFTVASKPVYTYYLQQANADYTADLSDADPIVNLTIRVQKAANYVQFFVPGITSSIENWAFAANDVIPAACGGIDTSTGEFADEITKNVGAQFGGFLYADGAVFSAKVTKSGTSQKYTFLLTSTTHIYAFTKERALNAGTFYRFKATSEALWTTKNAVEPNSYVDLGLPSGLKWATYNLGATTAKAHGEHFAWGELTGYMANGEDTFTRTFDWEHYKFCKNGSSPYGFTKYCSDSAQGYEGFVDGKSILEAVDDAATFRLGTGYRIPTQTEMNELISNCTWDWISDDEAETYGYTVTGPNKNTIFIPAGGVAGGTNTLSGRKTGCRYLMSSMVGNSDCCARMIAGIGWNPPGTSSYYKSWGWSIRPVHD